MKPFFTLLFSITVLAQEFSTIERTISLEHSAEYFAAAAEVNALSAQLERAQAKFNEMKARVIADCGDSHTPNLSIASKPRCDPKPIDPKKEEEK